MKEKTEYFGYCGVPQHKNNQYLHIGDKRWFYCNKCMVAWPWEFDITNKWEKESENSQTKNRERLTHYRIINPLKNEADKMMHEFLSVTIQRIKDLQKRYPEKYNCLKLEIDTIISKMEKFRNKVQSMEN